MDYERLINTRLFLLDMDGTLYLGDDVFDGAVDFIHSISETGRNYIYLAWITSPVCASWASPARRRTCSPPVWPRASS